MPSTTAPTNRSTRGSMARSATPGASDDVTPTSRSSPVTTVQQAPTTPSKQNKVSASGAGSIGPNGSIVPITSPLSRKSLANGLSAPSASSATTSPEKAPLTETAVEDMNVMKQKAPPALQDAFQRLMARAKDAKKVDTGKSGNAKTTGSAAPTMTAATRTSPVTDVAASASTPAADAIGQNGHSRRGPPSPTSLKTEILPAPPASLSDANYAPLNPELTGFVPGLAYTLANPPNATAAAPTAPAAASAQALTAVNGGGSMGGHEIVVQPRANATASAATSTTNDKKKKNAQPTFSLANPDWYEGKVPFALYAIVNKRPEATVPPRSNRKKQHSGKVAGNQAAEGRAPGSNATTAPSRHRSVEPVEPPTREASIVSTPAPSEDGGSTTPAASEVPLPGAPDAIPQIVGNQSLSADSLQSSIANGQSLDDTDMYPSEDSTPLIGDSSRPAVATDAGPAAREDDHGAAAPGDAAAGGAVDHHHRGAARSSAGLIHHASVDGDRPDTTLNEDKSMTEASARPAQVANGQTDAGRTSAEDVKDSSTIPAAGPAVAAAPAINGKKLRAQKTVSRPASPAITSDGLASLENDDTGDVSFASTSSYAATPSRPTRRAAAKVAARGSYYSPSAFVMQGPQQAVQDASAAERNGHRSSAGAENSSSVQTSAVTSHDSTAGDIKGKAKANGVPLTASEDTQYNNDYCSTCLGTGHFICCDSCPRSFHFACVNPPLDINTVPLDDDSAWHCQECSALRHPPPPPKKKDGIFGPLLFHLEQQNPTVFSLTPDIKAFFKGVATHADGSYIDVNRLRQIKVDKKGQIEHRDPFRLRDAKGKEVLCFHCGGGALPQDRGEAEALQAACTAEGDGSTLEAQQVRESQQWRRIVSCDFCPLHWHLDCLTPPLSTMPSNLRKWKCPCHVEELLAHTRVPKSSTQLQVVDLPIPTLQNTGYGPKQFYRPRVINSGEIDIIPDPLDNYSSSSSAASASGAHAGTSFGSNILPGWQNVNIPTADAQIPGGGIRRVRFRVPEKIVRTDWWLKVLQGGRERLLDVNAPFKYLEGQVRMQAVEDTSALDSLVQVALAELAREQGAPADIKSEAEETADTASPSTQSLVRLVLNAGSPASMRLQPLSLHEKPAVVQGYVPHKGGKLKREDDDAAPESAMRSSLEPTGGRGGDATASATKRQRPASMAREQPEDDAAKKAKLTEDGDAEEKELESLRAIRELMRRKGEDALLAFLQS